MLFPIVAALLSAGLAAAQSASFTDLVGTWSSKSNTTFTGPNFYDPVNEEFTEPKRTGISYSFSADGHYEEAYYRAVANPTNPNCPKGIIQWQHGSFQKLANGSLSLEPIKVDGRQLYSDPCTYKSAVYTRYNTTELFDRYEVVTDGYTKKTRLNLYKEDGAPLMPLYLAFSPPQMLPTTTLNPLTTATAGAKSTTKAKRSNPAFNPNLVHKTPQQQQLDRWWWIGIFMTATGALLYFGY